MVPGYMLVVAFERGLIFSLLSFVVMLVVQIAIGLEFLLTNKDAYLSMSYNFERQFVKMEQVNFQFLTEEFMHSAFFNRFLLVGHLSFLVLFLVFKWTGPSSKDKSAIGFGERIVLFFSDVGLVPVSRLVTDLSESKNLNSYN